LRFAKLRGLFCDLRARAHLQAAAARAGTEREVHLAEALRDAARLAAEDTPLPRAQALAVRAAATALRGERDAAIEGYRAAARAAEALDLNFLMGAMCKRLAALVGGDEGKTLRRAGDAIFARQEIVDVERLMHFLSPA
jgi:ATP/maltotriose-dependent transcriptional regulator MalT